MTRITDPRLGLSWPDPALKDAAPDVTADLALFAAAMQLLGICTQGLHADRPGAGVQRRFYYETDTVKLFYDNGTTWVDFTPSLADGSITTAKLVDLAVTGAKIADATITAAKLAATLKPSGTAAPGTEALRALGVTGSTAAAGNDARLSDPRVPIDNTVTTAKIVAGAVSSAKIAAGISLPGDANIGGLRMLLHALVANVAIDSGRFNGSFDGSGERIVPFNFAFFTPPHVTFNIHNTSGDYPGLNSVAVGSFTIGWQNHAGAGPFDIDWIAIGPV